MTKIKDKDYMNIGISLKAYEFSHMMHEKLGSKSTQSLYTFIQYEVQKMTVKVEKVTKINLKIISKPRAVNCRHGRKHVQSFKKTGLKLYEKLQSKGTHCLYI